MLRAASSCEALIKAAEQSILAVSRKRCKYSTFSIQNRRLYYGKNWKWCSLDSLASTSGYYIHSDIYEVWECGTVAETYRCGISTKWSNDSRVKIQVKKVSDFIFLYVVVRTTRYISLRVKNVTGNRYVSNLGKWSYQVSISLGASLPPFGLDRSFAQNAPWDWQSFHRSPY